MEWTQENMRRMIQLKKRGLTEKEIGEIMGCTHKAVNSITDKIKRGTRGYKLVNRLLVPWYEGYTIGHLDIETTNLEGNTGFMLCWCIKMGDKDEVRSSKITQREIRDYSFDRRLCQEFIEAIKDIDILTTYWGTGFDNKFLRTRCLYYDLPFPQYGSIYHFDMYYAVRRTMKLHRNSLRAATEFLGLQEKTHLDLDIWMKARVGHVPAIRYVYDHCVADVIALEQVWKEMEPFSKWTRKSI